MVNKEKIDNLSLEIKNSLKILLALGDENRQYIILEMLKFGNCNGVSVEQLK